MSMKQKFYKNWSVKKIWVVLNLIIMLVPVVISLFIYLSLYSIIESTVNHDSISLLRQIQRETDSQIADMQAVAIQVSSNASVKSILGASDVSDLYHDSNIGKIESDLSSYKTANSYIDNIVINFRNCGKLVSDTKAYDNDLLDTGILNETIMTSQGWDDIFKNALTQRLVYIKNATDANVGKLLYVQPLSPGGYNDYPAVLAITFNDSRLTGNTGDAAGLLDSGFMYLIDQNNDIVTAGNHTENVPDIPFDQLKNGKTLNYTGSKRRMLVVSFDSQYPNWKYAFAVPLNAVTQEVQFVRNVILVGLFLCVLVGSFTAMVVARRNYVPVNDLLKVIAKGGGDDRGKSDEFGLIRNSIVQAYEENKRAARQLDRQKNTLRLNFLESLVKGTVSKDLDLEKLLVDYGITFRSDAFLVLLFYIEDCGSLAAAGEPREGPPDLELAKFAITNIFEEIFARQHSCYFTEIDGILGCLVNAGGDHADTFEEDIQRACAEGLGVAENSLCMAVHISVSSVQRGAAGIPAAFQQALDALEYRSLYPDNQILLYEKTISPQMKNGYSLNDEMLLSNYIKSGDGEHAEAFVRSLFNNNTGEKKMPFSEFKSMVYDLNRTMFKLAGEIQPDPEDGTQAIFNELMLPKPLDQTEASLLQLAARLCDTVNSRKKDRSGEISAYVFRYVAEHYMESDLSVAGIADTLGITPSYLSKTFRKHTGKSILDYITEVRLDAAKKLLVQGRESLNLIAEKIGYIDSSAFIRIFKKQEGITPGKYRDINAR